MALTGLLRLTLAKAFSQLGSEASLVATPLFAIAILHVTPTQMGSLGVAERLPLLLSLLSGMLVDRFSSKRFLVIADFLRAIILVLVALAALRGQLSFTEFIAATVLVALSRLFYDVGMAVFIPAQFSVQGLDRIYAMMGRYDSVAELSGPALGGAIVQWLGAPFVILFDATTFLVSSIATASFKARSVPHADKKRLLSPLAGFHFIVRSRVIAIIIAGSTLWNLFYSGIYTLLILHYVNDLKLSSLLVGLSVVPTGAGYFVGSSFLLRFNEAIGKRRVMLIGAWLTVSWIVLILCARNADVASVVLILVGNLMFGFGQSLYNINALTIRQQATSDEIRGSVAATSQLLALSSLPVGSLLGGYLGAKMGLSIGLAALATGLGLSVVVMHLLKSVETQQSVRIEAA